MTLPRAIPQPSPSAEWVEQLLAENAALRAQIAAARGQALVPAHMDVYDCWQIGVSLEELATALRDRPTPYPWCLGYPRGNKAACIQAGYCRRNPNCGD